MDKIILDLERLDPGWIVIFDGKRKHLKSTEAVLRKLNQEIRKRLKDSGSLKLVRIETKVIIVKEGSTVNSKLNIAKIKEGESA
jgi:hypothetical protein